MTEWFRRLAEVPDLDYRGDSRARAATQAGRHAEPQLVVYDIADDKAE